MSVVFDNKIETIKEELFKDKYIDAPIRYSTETKWSIDMGVPLAYTKRTAPVTQDYTKLVNEIVERIDA